MLIDYIDIAALLPRSVWRMARYWHQLLRGLSVSTTGMVRRNRRSTGTWT